MLVLDLRTLTGPQIVSVISAEMQKWYDQGHTLKELSRRANVGATTLSNLWYRKTVYPRMTTVVMTLHALGYTLMKLEKDDDVG